MSRTNEVSEAMWTFAEHEHQDLVRGLERIHEAGCMIGTSPSTEALSAARAALRWFDRVLEPHLHWEDGWLFPRLDTIAGTPWASRGARFDHRQIREMSDHVRADAYTVERHPGSTHLAALRCHLFSLEALLRAHIEREERFLFPVLVDGTPDALDSVTAVSRDESRAD